MSTILLRPLAVMTTLLLCACAQPAPPVADDTAPSTAPSTAVNEGNAADGAAPVASPGTAQQTLADKEVDDRIERILGEPARYRAVIDALQRAVAADDAAGVAALVKYPISVTIDGAPVVLEDEAAFAARYANLMTPGIRAAIVDTRYSDLLVNQQGIMFGRGQAWINGLCSDSACTDPEVKVVTLQTAPE